MTAEREQRVPSLDGLRALSIILVIVSHLALAVTWNINPHNSQAREVAKYFELGRLGVTVFFVISG
jgi:peptidoglycan/LPS O-acetylase OafA/YrhL